MKKIKNTAYSYPTKYKEGFTKSDIDGLLKEFPDINLEKFNDALRGITCIQIDGEMVIYHCDIDLALRCGLENRNPTILEFD